MGVGISDVTSENAGTLKLKEERGVEIVTISPDGPAQKAGLKEHDVVLEFNGTRVESVEQFRRTIRETPVGRTVKLLISRDGAQQSISVKLGEKPATTGHLLREPGGDFVFRMPPMPPMPAMPSTPRPSEPFREFFFAVDGARLGIEGEAIGKQLGEFFGVPSGEGVLVHSVEAGSAAEKAGIKAGDVITKVEGENIKDLRDLRNAVRERREKGSYPVTLIRSKKEMTITVKIEKAQAPGDRV